MLGYFITHKLHHLHLYRVFGYSLADLHIEEPHQPPEPLSSLDNTHSVLELVQIVVAVVVQPL